MNDLSKLTREEQRALLLESISKMSLEDQIAFEQLAWWIAFERPKDDAPMTLERMTELLNDIRRENTRRRLGGRVGVVLPFPRRGNEGH